MGGVVSAADVPSANFTSNVTNGSAPLDVQFNDTSMGSPTSWSWDFGDNSTSTAQNPTHTYSAVGSYSVSLTAGNDAGNNTITLSNYITVTQTAPVASFTSNVTSGVNPLTVQFTDMSTGNATTWLWNFGDGTNSTLENPVHTYTTAGVYTVSLIAGNSGGNSTVIKSSYISVYLQDVYVSPTGSDTSGTGTSSNPYATIQKALNTVVAGGTVHVRSGTYTGTGNYGLTINKNVNIVGDGQNSTIINAEASGNLFTVGSGVMVTLCNLTLENGKSTTGGAISSSGTLNVTNCTFTGNTATSNGGAIYNTGSLNVTGTTFTSNRATTNGGAIYSSGSLDVTSSNFTSNTAASAGAIYNYGTLNVTNSVFTSNNGTNFAGAIFGDTGKITNINYSTFTSNNAPKGGALWNRGTLTVIGSVFTGNSATMGGAIQNTASGTTNVHYSSFTGNTATSGSTIYMGTGTFNATYNWWGSNSSPASQIYGTVDYSNWLYMTLNMDTTNIVNGSTINVTTSFNNIWNGTDVISINPATGHIPDGTVVIFSGNLGTFSPWTATTINGTATTTFTATTLGTDTISAQTGNQIISSNVMVRLGTVIVADNASTLSGNTIDLTAKLTDYNGNGLPGQNVTFTVNGINYNTTTDSNGVANISCPTSRAGIYNITASFAGDSVYHDISNNGTSFLIVQLTDVYLSPTGNDTSGDGTSSNPYATLEMALTIVYADGTVHVGSGTYTGTGNYGLTISKNVTIVGDDQTSTIITSSSSDSMFTITMDQYGNRKATLTGTTPGNIFNINPGVTVSISNLTLKNGSAVQGGAIYNNGTLTITNCTLTSNTVYQSDIYATYQYTYLYTFYRGGAIYNTGILSIADCTFNDNCASYQGGAIYNNGTIISISNCTFTNNTAIRGDGGAIYNTGTTVVSVNDCTFTNNTAVEGGAICNGPVTNQFAIYSTLNVTNCTFTGNTAATGWGGAILNGDAATLSVSNCSFANNTAATGGSIYSWGPLTVNECNFMNNTADSAAAIFNRKNATVTNCTFLNNKSTRYSGGAITNSGNMNITGCVFKNNSAVAGGAIDNRPDGTIGILSYCTFINNTATLNATYAGGGAIDNGGILPLLIGCVFVNNTATYGSSIYDDSSSNSMNAEYNWWGSNSDPSSQIYVSNGTIDYSNWLYMTETVNPTTIINGNTANVTVSFNNIWNGSSVVSIDPAIIHIPDGTVVSFASLLGNFDHATVSTVNGVATCVFTAANLGAGFVNATTNSQTVFGNVTVVGIVNDRTNATYTSIQAMIDDVNTLAGDVITFYTGSYTENIVLNKSLVFNASGVVHLIPLDASQPVLTITSSGSGSVIQGFIINGALSSSGVSLDSASNVTLVNNTINGNYVGVKFWNSTDNTIVNNTVTGNVWSGICLDTSNVNTISGNNVYGNQEGVFVANSSGNTLINNNAFGNTYTGITVLGGSDNLLQGNIVQGNGVSGILIQLSANNNLTGNTVQNNTWSGICLDGAIDSSLTGNSVSGNQEGIFAANNASGNTVTENTIYTNSGNGISLIQGSGNIVDNNTVASNGVSGVFVQDSSSTVISANNVQNNGWSGICLDTVNESLITGNSVAGNQEGIFMVNSWYNIVVNNSVTNSTYTGISVLSGSNNNNFTGNTVNGSGVSGLFLQNCDLNTIQGNTLQNNSWSGVCLDHATNTTVTANNFENNPEQALAVGGSGNSFDSNYWSDWPYTFARPIDGDNNISDANPQTKPY